MNTDEISTEWILFHGWHDGEILDYRTEFFDDHIVREIWPDSNWSLFESVGLPDKWAEKLYEASWDGFFNKKTGDLVRPSWKEAKDNGEGGLFGILVWDREKFKKDFKNFVDKVVSKRHEATGDDSYFDYYPGLWDVVNEVAKYLKDPEIDEYVKVGKKILWDEGMYHDEDVIEHGFGAEAEIPIRIPMT